MFFMSFTQKGVKMNKIDHISRLQEEGMVLIPCDPQSSSPLIDWRDLNGRNISEQKYDWATQFSDAAWAVLLGPESGIFALALSNSAELVQSGIMINIETTVSFQRNDKVIYLFKYPETGISNKELYFGRIKVQGLVPLTSSDYPDVRCTKWLVSPLDYSITDPPDQLIRITEKGYKRSNQYVPDTQLVDYIL